MTVSLRSRSRTIPALVLGAALGATALTPMLAPAADPAPVTQGQTRGHADLVERVAPAVVTIEVTKAAGKARFEGRGLPDDFPFEEFARRFGLPMPPQGKDMPQMRGEGTGFIVSEDGRIVTNAHVVDKADSVTVTLSDGRSLKAQVLGTDEATDIAVLKVEAEGLPSVTFGDSGGLRVGEEVIALGNPFGLGTTVTSGIVSALGRNINAGPYDDFIQTDAAINRGNSGGPLFNVDGEVVGINTAIMSPTGGSIGIGFAVPSAMAERIVADLATGGSVTRGWLGVSIQPVTEEVAVALGLDAASGAMVAEVMDGTPAADAGLRRGDIVTAVDGAAVTSPRDLTRMIGSARPGDHVTIGLIRAGQPQEMRVTLGTRDENPA